MKKSWMIELLHLSYTVENIKAHIFFFCQYWKKRNTE